MLSPRQFFSKVFGLYLHAVRESEGPFFQLLNLGGKLIRLNFASEDLLPYLMPAFEHLVVSTNAKPDFEVFLWDTESSGVPMIPRPWGDDAFLSRGEVKGFSDSRIITRYQLERDVLSIVDLENNQAIYWVKDAKRIPYFETGCPLSGIFPQWFLSKGLCFVHGGAVGLTDSGVLIVGQGGSGKSTTTLQCLDSPLFFLADDYCLLELNPLPQVYSLYSSGKLDAAQAEKFSFLDSLLYNRDNLQSEKALFFLASRFSDQLVSSLPLKAIVIPRVVDQHDTYVRPASPADGFKALVPSTLFQIAGSSENILRSISKIVRTVPCFNMFAGSDLPQIPEAVQELLRELK